MEGLEAILARVDLVLQRNRRIETLYIVLATILFASGITCIIVALATNQFAWSTPSTVTTGLLYWPMREIRDIRRYNIALAVAPVLIETLPAKKAQDELQRLLRTMYGDPS